MILIALGSNLTGPGLSGRRATLVRALELLGEEGVDLEAISPWYESAPVPASDQPWFVNGVAVVTTGRDAVSLLAALHRVEAALGRRRSVQNAARTVDLDLLAYGDVVRLETSDDPPHLPHPRLHARRFVLVPLRDVAPSWRHPVTGLTAEAMLGRLESEPDDVRPLPSS